MKDGCSSLERLNVISSSIYFVKTKKEKEKTENNVLFLS